MKGDADDFSSKTFSIFVPTLILFFCHCLCIWATTLDKNNKEQSNKVLGMVFWIIPITSLLVNGVALGLDLNVDIAVRVLLAIMFLVFGNYMPKCKQNLLVVEVSSS